MSAVTTAEVIESDGCKITLRRVDGPDARELFFNCQPDTDLADPGQQAESVYRAILATLEAEGASFQSVVYETLFLRNLEADLDFVRSARDQTLAAVGEEAHQPATSEIEQPPLNQGAHLEVLIQAIIPHQATLRSDTFKAQTACSCDECARLHGLRVQVGDEARLYAGGLYGRGDDAYEQTHAMFAVAENLLQQAGMDFGDVTRTWIYLPEMERDYAGFNRARREFFKARGVDPIPASTGIGARLVPEEHDLLLGLYAVKGGTPTARTVMTTPTLNEAPVYGSDFSRGMRIIETNKVALHISGTASLDEAGRTVHLDDFEAQADRMLVNVAALLKGQGASFGDVVYAITYVKNPSDARRLREKFRDAGYEGFPNVLVAAEVCRPELLCETEALAMLPRNTS